MFGTFGPGHRRTSFYFSYGSTLHVVMRRTHARMTTTRHLLETSCPNSGHFSKTAEVGYKLLPYHLLKACACLRISELVPLRRLRFVKLLYGSVPILLYSNVVSLRTLYDRCGWALGGAYPRICPFADGSLGPFAYLGKYPSVVHGIVVVILFHHRGQQDTPFFRRTTPFPSVSRPIEDEQKTHLKT